MTGRRVFIRRMVVVLALLLAGCRSTGTELDAAGSQRFEPPPDYAVWYREVEVCMTKRGDFGAIRWYVADEVRLGGQLASGVILLPHTITMGRKWVNHKLSVKHEMIHHVGKEGNSLHGTDIFFRCGG